ncbi:MAG: M56 family metallopeptidase [Chitinophagaceae bacterium]|nr:M56 family metallopeptidase [Chitinophagaceae bacterium]
MTAMYQSPFLLALGWTIASSLWQTALLWMIYQVMTNAHGKISPAARHNLALMAIVCAFGWFGITLYSKYNEFQQVLYAAVAFSPAAGTAAAGADTGGFALTGFLNQYLPYLSASYLLVLTLLAIRLVKAYFHAQKIKTTGLQEIDEYWSTKVERYTGYLRIHKKVSIYISSYIDVPATLDFFKPVILLPVAAFTQLTPQQVESVILHELAHIKRNDYLINILVSVIETILFFNPFVHLLGKALKKEREHCCDDFVLHFRFDPHSYASALLSLEKLRIHSTPAGAIAATGSSRQLLGRVKRIMNVKSGGFNYGQKLLALVITAGILISVAWLSPSSRQNSAGDEKVQAATGQEEHMETKEAPVTGKIMKKRAVVVPRPVEPVVKNTSRALKAAVPPSPGIHTLPGSESIAGNYLSVVPVTPSFPTPPHEAPVPEIYSLPAIGPENIQEPGDLLYLKDNLLKQYREYERKEIPGNAITGLKSRELKLQQLEHLLTGDIFEKINLDFESHPYFDLRFTNKKPDSKKDEKAKEYKNLYQFNWNDDAAQKQFFYQKKMQLDSLKQQLIKMTEQPKFLRAKTAEADRQIQNAARQAYLSVIATHNRKEKIAGDLRRRDEKKRSAAVVINTMTGEENPYGSGATIAGEPGKAQPADMHASSARKVSKVVIDAGSHEKTIIISIE